MIYLFIQSLICIYFSFRSMCSSFPLNLLVSISWEWRKEIAAKGEGNAEV